MYGQMNHFLAKKSFRKDLYWLLVKSMDIRRNEQFFPCPWLGGSYLIFHILPSAKGRNLEIRCHRCVIDFEFRNVKSCLVPNSCPQEHSDLSKELTFELIEKAFTLMGGNCGKLKRSERYMKENHPGWTLLASFRDNSWNAVHSRPTELMNEHIRLSLPFPRRLSSTRR